MLPKKNLNQQTVESEEHLEERLELFNEVSRRYLGYEPPNEEDKMEETFESIAYFTRKFREWLTLGKAPSMC